MVHWQRQLGNKTCYDLNLKDNVSCSNCKNWAEIIMLNPSKERKTSCEKPWKFCVENSSTTTNPSSSTASLQYHYRKIRTSLACWHQFIQNETLSYKRIPKEVLEAAAWARFELATHPLPLSSSSNARSNDHHNDAGQERRRGRTRTTRQSKQQERTYSNDATSTMTRRTKRVTKTSSRRTSTRTSKSKSIITEETTTFFKNTTPSITNPFSSNDNKAPRAPTGSNKIHLLSPDSKSRATPAKKSRAPPPRQMSPLASSSNAFFSTLNSIGSKLQDLNLLAASCAPCGSSHYDYNNAVLDEDDEKNDNKQEDDEDEEQDEDKEEDHHRDKDEEEEEEEEAAAPSSPSNNLAAAKEEIIRLQKQLLNALHKSNEHLNNINKMKMQMENQEVLHLRQLQKLAVQHHQQLLHHQKAYETKINKSLLSKHIKKKNRYETFIRQFKSNKFSGQSKFGRRLLSQMMAMHPNTTFDTISSFSNLIRAQLLAEGDIFNNGDVSFQEVAQSCPKPGMFRNLLDEAATDIMFTSHLDIFHQDVEDHDKHPTVYFSCDKGPHGHYIKILSWYSKRLDKVTQIILDVDKSFGDSKSSAEAM